MNIEVENVDGIQIVRPFGDVDLKASPELRQKLQETLEDKPASLVIDLANCSYIDSSGIATLVEALQKLKTYDGKLAISSAVQRVKDIFEIAHLDGVFPMYESLDEAKASFS